MFPLSTQCKQWMFGSEEELNKLRENANVEHIRTYGKHVAVSVKQCFEYLICKRDIL